MRKLFAILVACVLLMTCAVPAAALDGQVIYAEGAEKFFFLPGSDYSPTDLFPEFKNVMPGDSLTERVEIRRVNDALNIRQGEFQLPEE